MLGMLTAQLASVLAKAGPEKSPIRSRWQHAAVPTWRRVPPTAVCVDRRGLHLLSGWHSGGVAWRNAFRHGYPLPPGLGSGARSANAELAA
jgi:hypothetical protein